MQLRRLLRRFRLLIVTAAWATASGADLPPLLTLSEALNIALTNSTVLREAMAHLDQTSGHYLQSRSALMPQVGIFARQSIQTISLQGFGIDTLRRARDRWSSGEPAEARPIGTKFGVLWQNPGFCHTLKWRNPEFFAAPIIETNIPPSSAAPASWQQPPTSFPFNAPTLPVRRFTAETEYFLGQHFQTRRGAVECLPHTEQAPGRKMTASRFGLAHQNRPLECYFSERSRSTQTGWLR
jgi:hypothetical protein